MLADTLLGIEEPGKKQFKFEKNTKLFQGYLQSPYCKTNQGQLVQQHPSP